MPGTIEKFAFDVLDRINLATRIDDICDTLRQTSATYGFTSFLITGVPSAGETLAQHVMLSGWSAEWMERYNSRNYVHVDPVVQQIRSSTRPFRWSNVRYDKHRNPRGHRVMLEATEFSMHDGYTVPIYGYDGYQACVTMGGRPHDVSERELSALHLISVFGFSSVQALIAREVSKQEAPRFKLSPREAEVLKWTAEGKTAWEVSAILNISENTVETHLRAVTRKMNVAGKVRMRWRSQYAMA